MRTSFDSCLPHPVHLRTWYSKIDGNPQFTEESFKAIKSLTENTAGPVYANLVFDEMPIKKHIRYNNGTYDGYADMGLGFEDTGEIASLNLVFMLTCINMDWKIPIGYFSINGINAEKKARLVRTALELCQEVSVKVIGLTFDGTSTNITMAKLLGGDFSDPNHIVSVFEYAGHVVHIVPDPCHNLKLIRNSFEFFGTMIDIDGGEVKWSYLWDLHYLQEDSGMRFGNKLKKSHLKFHNQIMKVYLAAQVFSRSVGKHCNFVRTS